MPAKRISTNIKCQISNIKLFIGNWKLEIGNSARSQAGLGQLALILLLLAGIGLGTYLVQQRTNILPHAETTTVGPPSPPGTVVKVEDLESINPGAVAEKQGELTKAKIVSRQQTQASDGFLIHFVWSDGRESWDSKDLQGNRIRSKSYAIRNGKKATQTGESRSGSTVITKWTDGTIEYNIFNGERYDVGASYSICCTTGSTSTGKTGTGTTSGTGNTSNSKGKNSKSSSGNTTTTTSKTANGSSQTTTTTKTTTPSNNEKDRTNVPLTKQDITGFRDRFQSVVSALGNRKNSGNLKIVFDIANNELNSLVDKIKSCPDDSKVGQCLEQYRGNFDFAKTAARLAAFYGIYQGVTGICAKVDFGVINKSFDDLIYAKPAAGPGSSDGRVNLCSNSQGVKVWKVLGNEVVNGQFPQLDIENSDTRWKPNPECKDLPAVVINKLGQAEKIYDTQPGFVRDTLCDGKTKQ